MHRNQAVNIIQREPHQRVLLIFSNRIFETTPFIVFITIASVSLYIIATIRFTQSDSNIELDILSRIKLPVTQKYCQEIRL